MNARMKLRMAGGLCLWLMAGFALADEIELKPGHPERYTVVRGDTLWDIAGKFLSRPWQWPEIWHDNRQIANPHWIYPGDELVLSVVDGKPSLQVGYRSGGEGAGAAEASGGDVRLSPVVRVEPLGQAIPTIPLSAIQQFLTEPKVALDPAQMESAPYVVAMADEHVVVGSGDRVYVRGLADRRLGVGYMVFRPGQPYTDAETGDILGYEALYVGNADVQAVDELATLRVTKSAREVVIGDRILPVDYEKVQTRYQPHPPALPVWGHVISVVDGVSQIGQWNIVVIDRGTADGIETGAVLEVRQGGASQRDIMSPSANEVITLPAEKEGLLMVFRPFERVSFALVMNAVRAIHLNDTVTNP